MSENSKQARGSNIYLMGCMGAGKSTAGRLLARVLGRDFLDLDEQIVARAGRSISQIFEDEGEDGFRQREHDALRQVAQRENIVVALGGGAVLRDDNWELIQQSGISIYLKVRPELLVQRIEGEPERPLLVGLTPQQRLQRISEIVESRKERYEQADIILENERTPAEAVAAICEALSVNGESTGGVNIVHVPLGETCAVPGWRRSCSASLPARLLRASAQRRCSTVDSSVGGKRGQVLYPLKLRELFGSLRPFF